MFATFARPRPRAILLALVALALPTSAHAQETPRALDHPDTRIWNSIQGRALSPDGRWLAYTIVPWEGDPTLVIVRTDGSDERRFRGESASFTRDSRFVAFTVPPVEAIVDSLKLAETRGDDLPGDSLAIVTLARAFADPSRDAGVFRAGPVESFRVPEDAGVWIAYHLSEAPEAEAEEGEGGPEESEAEEPAEEEERSDAWERYHEKDDGTPLVLRDLESGVEHTFESVVGYAVAPSGTALAYATSTEDGAGDGVFLVDPASGAATAALTGAGLYDQLVFDDSGARFAFVSNTADWEAERPAFALYRSDGARGALVADSGTAGVPSGWWVSENGDVSFSEDGTRLFFGTAPRPAPEPDEEILEEDRVEVDVWNWQDDYLQPMQLLQANRERNRTYLAVVHDGLDGIVQLGTLEVPDVDYADTGAGDYALGESDLPYRQLVSWDGSYRDAYAIDMRTGDRRPIIRGLRGNVSLSPGGVWASWWDGDTRDWKVAPMAGGPTRSLTGDISAAFYDELDDHPQDPPPYGGALWTEDDEGVLVYDRHDVWRTDPTGAADPLRLTNGRASDVRYRVVPIDDEGGGGFGFFGGGGDAVPNGEIVLSRFDMETRAEAYVAARSDRAATPRELLGGNASFGRPVKARDAERMVWTRETFVEFPDLWVGDTRFANGRKLSDANPQQSDFRWGTAELVSWLSADRTPLDGILYKPDGFDPNRQYPMMVYFYERLSDGLHQYQAPIPNRASIRYSFYVSRGYLVFVPDIPYEVGYPGESALDAVVPGVLQLIDEGFVDPARIGVQGHSWGGYQIAYMITKTNLFAAAEAGAPVSNMTSAYGGIRWASGMSRMFQYERTQSRIGGTLWDERDRYIHNSPVFFADKIRTPLLMLHNDEDGAVPWYQGIEMFVAMRRLGKPAFMLNYNGEGHGLGQAANQADWTIRMQQFFDHYLMDAPEPEWMAEGVPAVDKGRNLGLRLVETTASQEGGDR